MRSRIPQEKLYCLTCKENIIPLIENPNDRYVKDIDPAILIKTLNENEIACHICGLIKTREELDMFHRNVDKGYGYQYRKCPNCSNHFKVG
jgi:DNA-directed RNA polymerase subunit RPC12/RpoP